MKLLNGKYKIRNRIMAAFLAVTMLLTLVPTGQMQVYAAGEGKVNVDSFTVKVNGVPLENVTEIKEGDKVLILCNWSLDDSDKTVDTYKVDLSPMLSNLKLVAGTPATVYDSELGAVGTVTIDENGVATYVFTNDKFLESTSRTGSSTYDGVVTSTDKKNDNGKDVTFGIGTTKKTVKYYADQKTSELNVQKSKSSSAMLENGKLYQTFEVTLSAKDGIVKGITLEDIAGLGLTNLSELKIKTVNGSDVGVTVGTSCSDMAQLNAVLQGAVLAAGESITISYKMEVNPSIYDKTSDIEAFGNVVKAQYKDNRDNDKEKESNKVYAEAKGPEMSKNSVGDYDKTTGIITWKVTVRLNDYLEDFQKSGKSIEDYITDIVETPGTGLEPAVKLTGITEESEGVYSIVYTTAVTDEYKQRLENGSYTFKNTITAKVNGTDVKASADKTVNADNRIEKTCTGFDSTTRTLTWNVTLNIPDNVTDVVIRDYVQEADRHVLQPTVTYAGTTIVNSDTIVDSSIVKSWESAWQGYSMALTDAFVSSHAGQPVTFTYTTVIQDGYVWNNQTEFTNKAHLSYKDAVLGDQNQEATATWKDVNKQGIVLTKKAIADNDKDSITYEVKVDLSEMASLAAGDTVTITDVLPDIMKFDGNVTAKLVYIHQYWEDSNHGSVSVTVSDVTGANAKDFSFTVTEQMVNAVADGKAATDWYKPTVIISYTASIADERSFVSAGKKESITNTVTGKKGETSLGTASATAELTPKTVVKKTATYTADSAPDIKYEIEINPNALTLSTNGKLTGEDHLGTALTYNDDVEITEVSTGTVLTRGTDYTVSISSDKKKMIVVVPDGKHLKLTYTAKLNLRTYADETKNEHLTDENSYNEFSLSGFSSDQTKDRKSYNQVAYTPKHQTVSETGSVTIKKFWTNNGTYTALAGSEFKIVQASYDSATGKMVDGTVIKDNIVVGVDGTIKVENLRKDRIYALYETKAKEGFARRTDPYYFIIDDDNSVTLPSGVIIEKFVEEENELEYENQLEAKLTLTKAVENVEWDEVKNDITFTVKKGDLVVATISGADMQKTGNGYETTIKQLEAGEYTIVETIATSGKTPKTITYKIDNSAVKSGQEVTGIVLTAGGTGTVTFTNTYEVKKGSLEITKTVTGDRNWEQVKNTMSFKVTDETGAEITGSPVAGTAFTETTPGSGIYHYVFNGLTAGKTYTVTEVLTGEDAAYARTTTYTGAASGTGETAVSAPISNAANVVVAFTNTYTKLQGSLEITKTVTGDRNWEQVKNTMSFKVTDETGAEITGSPVAGTAFTETTPGSGIYHYVFNGLTAGKTYTVTEVLTGEDAAYARTTTYTGAASGTGETAVSAPISNAANVVVAFTNTYTKLQGSLEITKTVTGDRNWEQVKNTMSFKVTDETGAEITGSPVAGTAFTETTPGSGIYHYVFNGLTAGKTYTVTEVLTGEDAAYARTTTYTAAASGTGETAVSTPINNTANTVVAFTNAYTAKTGEIEVTKKFGGSELPSNFETVTLTVENEAGTVVGSKTLAEIRSAAAAGTEGYAVTGSGAGAVYTWTLKDLPYGKYKVTETVTAANGYQCTARYQINATAEKNYDGTVKPEVTVGAATQKMAFTNTYTKLQGSLEITKTVTGDRNWEQVKNTMSFKVMDETGAEITGSPVAGIAFTETTPGSGIYHYVFNGLTAGKTYTVTEVLTGEDAAYARTTTYTGAASGTGETAVSAPISNAANVVVAFTNTYTKLQGSLEITKTVTGDRNWEQVKNTMSFKVTDETGAEITGSPVAGTAFTETTPGSGIYHYVFNGLTAGKTYTVTEVLTGEDAAYARTTTYTAAAGGTGETAVSAPISNAANVVVAFTNAYTAKTGKIEVTKKFGGSELPANFETVTLTVENEAGTVVGSKTLAEIRSAAAAGTEGYAVTGSGAGAVYTWTLKDLPYGKYKVTETVTAANGYQCTAKYQINATAEKDYDSTAKPEVTVGAATQKVVFTNAYTKLQGSLEITKTVTGDRNWEQVKNTMTFKVTDETGAEITGSPVAGTAFTETTPGSGIYHYVFNGLTAGKTYTVTEVLTGEDAAYARTTTYTAAAGGTGETAVSAPINNTANTVVAFTNAYTAKTGEIEVTKKFGGSELPSNFETVTLTVENEAGTVVGSKTLAEIRSAAAAGTEGYAVTGSGAGAVYTWTLKDLPYGKYTVTETVTAANGYQCTARYQINATAEKNYDGTVKPEVTVGAATQKVAFTNTYTKLQGSLEITKTVTGDRNWEQVKNTMSFKVTDETGAEITGSPVAGTAFTETTPGSGIYHYVFNGLTAGKTYTVTEVLTGEDAAYARTTTYTAAAGGTGETAVSAPISNAANVVVAFTNTYTKKAGKLVITKSVAGNVDKAKAEAAISFKVTRTADGTSKTYKLSDFTYDTAGKIWKLELDTAPGGYQVEETRNVVGGFTLKKVQYEVDASGKVDGSSVQVQVNDGASIKVAFENTYEKKTTTPSNPTTPPVTPTTPPSPQPPEPTPTDPGTPGTGDNSNLAFWFILFAVSGMGLVALAISEKKNKKKQ